MTKPDPFVDDFRSDHQRDLENEAYGAAGELHRKLAALEALLRKPVEITVYSHRYGWNLKVSDNG